ncbi:hypothetical protein NHX12_015192 [Muraenolepis orangiensis]|uniref:WW domain-containing protein n=1 Tax=Muraenolepis orangiensis TaxID=630683 RepID=A0A9Q0I2S5_9TELE|nr:hypothetical protein NHX12_015192 [Muraenolepis orangiensis]
MINYFIFPGLIIGSPNRGSSVSTASVGSQTTNLGKNHKENVAAKISEIKKKSMDKAKQEERMSKEFAAMEEAATKAYEEDLKRLQLESGGPVPEAKPAVQPAVPPKPPKHPPKQEKLHKKAAKVKLEKPEKSRNLWTKAKSDSGHAYYYNAETGESAWEQPEGFQGDDSEAPHPGQNEAWSVGVWLEAASPGGYIYYYNSETGETSWERPAHLPPLEEPSAPGTEPTPGVELLSHGAQASTPGLEQLSHGAQASTPMEESAGEAHPQPKVPKISLGKRKAEPLEEEPEVKRSKKPTAYGSWEPIKEEVDPYAGIDLQLPQVEEYLEPLELTLPPEPRPQFRERTITSLGDQGGPAAFRKNKMHNGKARSLRQRAEEDD